MLILLRHVVSATRSRPGSSPSKQVAPERETAGQAPVPYARGATTSVLMVAGVTRSVDLPGPGRAVLLPGAPCVRQCPTQCLRGDVHDPRNYDVVPVSLAAGGELCGRSLVVEICRAQPIEHDPEHALPRVESPL